MEWQQPGESSTGEPLEWDSLVASLVSGVGRGADCDASAAAPPAAAPSTAAAFCTGAAHSLFQPGLQLALHPRILDLQHTMQAQPCPDALPVSRHSSGDFKVATPPRSPQQAAPALLAAPSRQASLPIDIASGGGGAAAAAAGARLGIKRSASAGAWCGPRVRLGGRILKPEEAARHLAAHTARRRTCSTGNLAAAAAAAEPQRGAGGMLSCSLGGCSSLLYESCEPGSWRELMGQEDLLMCSSDECSLDSLLPQLLETGCSPCSSGSSGVLDEQSSGRHPLLGLQLQLQPPLLAPHTAGSGGSTPVPTTPHLLSPQSSKRRRRLQQLLERRRAARFGTAAAQALARLPPPHSPSSSQAFDAPTLLPSLLRAGQAVAPAAGAGHRSARDAEVLLHCAPPQPQAPAAESALQYLTCPDAGSAAAAVAHAAAGGVAAALPCDALHASQSTGSLPGTGMEASFWAAPCPTQAGLPFAWPGLSGPSLAACLAGDGLLGARFLGVAADGQLF